tara:strand:- start:203 stop:517 length:315 start_codon:yes stop_codon:yes gene_type:complete
MDSAGTLDLPFAQQLESKPKSFISQVKEFMKETDGGAIPVSAAAVALGVSHQRVHELIKKEIEAEGSGLRAKKFNKTILVFITDIEKRLDMPKSKGGRPKKNNT